MKSNVIIAMAIGFLGVSGLVEAAPAYGTKMPVKNQWFVGGQTHAILKRTLDRNNGEIKSLQYFLLLSYGVTDWFSLDLKGGAGDIEQKPSSGNTIQYPAFMAGGYGFRVRLYERDRKKIVFGFQHISVHPQTVDVTAAHDTKNKAVIDDWQFSFLGSYAFKHFTPYVGGKWSRTDCIHWVNEIRARRKSELDKSLGGIAGFDLPLTHRMWFNVEGQWGDGEAVSGSLNFSF